ncbi:MAG: DMT family transporter [Rubrivivax sp.]
MPSAICWVLAVSLPLSLPAMLFTAPAAAVLQAATPAAWAGFAYVAVFSMWLGFFAWYRGLALGGVLRVSQVQLAQPFIALLAAVPLLGEALEPLTVGFALAVAAVVFAGKRMPVAAAHAPVPTPAPALATTARGLQRSDAEVLSTTTTIDRRMNTPRQRACAFCVLRAFCALCVSPREEMAPAALTSTIREILKLTERPGISRRWPARPTPSVQAMLEARAVLREQPREAAYAAAATRRCANGWPVNWRRWG